MTDDDDDDDHIDRGPFKGWTDGAVALFFLAVIVALVVVMVRGCS